jgi:hypothetical protein
VKAVKNGNSGMAHGICGVSVSTASGFLAIDARSIQEPRACMVCRMDGSSFEETLIEVWRQALVENAKVVELGSVRYPVRHTSRHGLRQVDFAFKGREIRGLEQNPHTKSRWAQFARSGKKVMQFLVEGRYIGNVADGKATLYGSARDDRS